MSYTEKGTWVYLLASAGVWAGYVVVLLDRADGGPVADVAYVAPMLWAVGISILASTVGRVVVEVVRPSDSSLADERDRDIDRRGEYVAGIVLAVAVVGPLVLALVEADHFWVANTIYTAYVVSAVAGSAVKLVTYRRGL